jgi:hypothetical protein
MMSYDPKYYRKGGRPRKPDSLHTTLKVSTNLLDILNSLRRHKEERHNEIVLRVIKERAMFKQEVEKLKSQLQDQ